MLKIYSDIDGCIADYASTFFSYIEEREPHVTMNPSCVPGYWFDEWINFKSNKWNVDLSVERIYELYCDFFLLKNGLDILPAYEDYINGFNKFQSHLESGKASITYVTSRCKMFHPVLQERLKDHLEYIKACTVKWLFKNKLISPRYIDKGQPGGIFFEDKVEFVKKNPCDIFIEDEYYTAKELTKYVPLVFLVDRSYNQNQEENESFIRCTVKELWTIVSFIINKME